MTPYEIMLSESQERMLIIVKKGREPEVQRIFDKWDLPWAEVGTVTDTGRMVVNFHGQTVADIPAAKLANDAPVYQREAREPAYLAKVREFSLESVPDLEDAENALKQLLSWPSIASKNWVYRQYDHMVRLGTSVNPGSDAAVVRIKGDSIPPTPDHPLGDWPSVPEKYLALSVDCNATYVYLDPYEGGKAAVAEAARNLACTGAVPIGSTDNLNFGNPHNPEIFHQLKEAVRGLADGCRAFKAPVTGGNVSLYNQNPIGAIDPTPTIAMVGLIEKPEHITTQWFKNDGDTVLLLGEGIDANDPLKGLGGSAYLKRVRGLKSGRPPHCDLEGEVRTHDALREMIRSGHVKSAHDCSEGGLAVALAESCISNQQARGSYHRLGASIDLSAWNRERLDALLFGETHARIVLSVDAGRQEEMSRIAALHQVPIALLGTVGGDQLKLKCGGNEIIWDLAELHDLWWNSIARIMANEALSPGEEEAASF